MRLGPRDHPDGTGLQPPGPDGRAGRHARPRLGRPGRVRFGRVVLGGRAGRLRHRPGGQAGGLAGGPRGGPPLHDRDPLHRRRRAGSSPCRPATSCPSRSRSPTRPCGWPAAAATPSCWRRRRGSGRSASPSSSPRTPRQWVDDYEADPPRPLRPGRAGRQPPGGLRHPHDVRPRRGRRPSPGASRGPTSSATRWPTSTSSATTSRPGPTSGRSSRSAGARWATHPRRPLAAAARDPGGQGGRRRRDRPAGGGRARPTSCASSCAATRRPASTS